MSEVGESSEGVETVLVEAVTANVESIPGVERVTLATAPGVEGPRIAAILPGRDAGDLPRE
jgi:hypothetical protein